MKVLTSTLILLLLAGCSPDEPNQEISAPTSQLYKKSPGKEPANPANAHDQAGTIYSELLDAYFLSPTSSPNVQQLIYQGETIAFLNPAFVNLLGQSSYNSLMANDVYPYLIHDDFNVRDYLDTAYSEHATEIISDIALQLNQLKSKDAAYQEVYTYLISVESVVSHDPGLSPEERSAILTTSSILRNALHHDTKRKRRDRDWEWMTSNYTATANAALESQPQAIMMSFATDVYYN